MSRMRSHLAHNLVAYLALFVALGGSSYAAVTIGSAQIKDNSVTSKDLKNNGIRSRDIRNGTIVGRDVAKGTLLRANFKSGQLPTGSRGATGPAGPQGPQGATGPAGPRGPSFGDTKLISNVNGFACNTPVTVGSMALTLQDSSRIWASGQGSIRQNDPNGADEFELYVQLRDSGGAIVATSPANWDSRFPTGDEDTVNTMSTAGALHIGADPSDGTQPVYVAPAGSYTLELVVFAGDGNCPGAKPNFGYNQNGALGYIVLGTS